MCMKATIRIISQTVLANPEDIVNPRLKVYGSAVVNIPEPFGMRDYNVRMSVWMSTYAKILEKDPSALIKISPHYPEPSLPF